MTGEPAETSSEISEAVLRMRMSNAILDLTQLMKEMSALFEQFAVLASELEQRVRKLEEELG